MASTGTSVSPHSGAGRDLPKGGGSRHLGAEQRVRREGADEAGERTGSEHSGEWRFYPEPGKDPSGALAQLT